MKDYVSEINDHNIKVPAKLKTALNKFFNEVDCAEGCLIRERNHEGTKAKICLIIESSSLYHYLQGEYGWEIHTKFHNTFLKTGFFPEMANSCVVCFYQD